MRNLLPDINLIYVISVVRCPALELENGEYVEPLCPNSDVTPPYEYQCSASCNINYRLVGEETLTCTAEAVWDVDVPICECKMMYIA